MARYTADSRDKVREAVDMVDLVSTRTELKRAGGGRFTGRCPFHEERTPSFSVNADDGLYHCFGCGVGGDMFTFVREMEGLDFVGALEWLAARYGVELEVEDEDPAAAERRRRRERLLDLLERAQRFYVRLLWDSDEAAGARRYLAERGLEEETLRAFRVGYAPDRWDGLLTAARKQGFSDQELEACGLVRKRSSGSGIYDFFRGRVLFPLCDVRGRVLGFGGRWLGPDDQPKYVNSVDNEVYRKGKHLFGADVARVHATRAGTVVLAEGYTDVLALHQSGVRNAVGLMGTALTEEQVGELGRLARTVLLALDADSAGQEAMLRAAKVAAGRNLELRVVPLPPGQDPADLVQAEGPAAAQRLVEASVPFVRFRVERELSRETLDDAEAKDRAIAALKPVFATLEPSALREELVGVVAERTAFPVGTVAGWLPAPRSAARPGPARPDGGSAGPARPPLRPRVEGAADPVRRAQRQFVLMCLAAPGEGERALAEVPDEAFVDDALRRAVGHLRTHLRQPGEGLDHEDGELVGLIASLSAAAERIERPTASGVRAQLATMQLAQIDRQMAEARASGAGGIAALRTKRDAVKRDYDAMVREQMAATKAPDP
ncbi:DNA primase [Conexibacter sp. SYSU D00693]|uniref:DNA primase n=1 Tax=Conexibacter sp. SYSU D00693 TaxID=2812560 RepID=UPI00196ABF98|nr:DNA primase [Conexibacter sp. SYSU D00693]